LGVGKVKTEYNGDYGNALFDFKTKAYYSNAAFLSFKISPSFDIGVEASRGDYGYYIDIVNNFEGGKNDAFLFLNYQLNNGNLFHFNNKISPFFTLSFGIANYYLTNNAYPYPTAILTNYNDLITGLGMGIQYKITKHFSLRYKFMYNLTNSDAHDQNRGGSSKISIFGTDIFPNYKFGNDHYGQHVLSLVFHLFDPKDKDDDGIRDKYQKVR